MKSIHHRFFAVAIAIGGGILISANMYKVAATMGLLMTDFNIDTILAGGLITIVSLMGIILGLPAGGILVRVGSKKLGIFAMLSATIGSILGTFSKTFILLMVSRFIEGFGFALIGVIVPSIISEYYNEEERGIPMAIWACWISIGLLLSLKLTNILTSDSQPSSWRSVWSIMSLLLVIITGLFWIIPKQNFPKTTNFKHTFSEYFNKDAWSLSIIFITFSTGITAITNFTGTYCQTMLHMSLAQANTITSYLTYGLLIGGILNGVMLNRISNHNRILILGMLFSNIIFGTMFLYPADFVAIYMFAGGFVLSVIPPTIFTIAPECATSPQMVGVIMGILAVGQNIGGFSASTIGNIIATYGYHTTSLIIGGMSVVGTVVSFLFVQNIKRKTR